MIRDRNILLPLLQSSDLPEYLEELNRFWKDEEARRADFYDWLDEDKKAEFIFGEIVMHSPARAAHINVSQKIEYLIFDFIRNKNLGWIYREQALVRFARNDFMPDLIYLSKEKNEQIIDETTLFPIPDLIVEVTSISTEATDRGLKKTEYAKGGVTEYWIVDPRARTIEQYILSGNGEYVLHEDTPGIIRSKVIAGLEFNVEQIFKASAKKTLIK